MTKKELMILIVLHILLAIYSIGGIFSKMAANVQFLSLEFCLYYLGIIMILGIYAVFWQQIIKRMPLTVAFANKAITVIWGIVWGFLFFNETITIGQLIGAGLIMIGIVLYCTDTGVIGEC